jgi:hypothetical protein
VDQDIDDDDNEVYEHHAASNLHDMDNDFAYADEQFEEANFDSDLLLNNDSDASHDITQDNFVQDHGFFTINVDNSVCNFMHFDCKERVTGHVLLNHATVCMRRFGRAPICGTQVQRHFIQHLAFSIPSESSPLLYMESLLFTWIFYHSASNKTFSILGALPQLACSINKRNPFGLESFIIMNHNLCIVNYGSLSSSCIHYIKFLHDVMCDKTLCHSDSRNVTDCGFVVNKKSPTGLSVQNKGETTLSNSTDSHQMVHSLSVSQEYIKYHMYPAFTCTQKNFLA